MNKRVTVTKHDYDLVKWLVRYYKETSTVKFPAHQNLDELLEKLNPTQTKEQPNA